MNTTQSSMKSYIILAVVVLVAAAGYFYWKGTDISDATTLGEVSMEEQQAGARVFSLLNQVKSIKIDDSLFKDPAYQTLRDNTVQIPTLPVGRPNPFAPVPGIPSSGGAQR